MKNSRTNLIKALVNNKMHIFERFYIDYGIYL